MLINPKGEMEMKTTKNIKEYTIKQSDDTIKLHAIIAAIAIYARKHWDVSAILKHQDRIILEFNNGEMLSLNIKKIS